MSNLELECNPAFQRIRIVDRELQKALKIVDTLTQEREAAFQKFWKLRKRHKRDQFLRKGKEVEAELQSSEGASKKGRSKSSGPSASWATCPVQKGN